ncbi:amino acid dehydrogenase [Alkanindiges hydrocarboniclasticus]|uniref:Amino acid dehydrogenase n=1 Tax=Alkanindiges hydrocarboniclasticus TaxID=1907941 RepID=A0A1S8CXD7_9GAMM|nr:D-amino acid dehydrogenase [Alkanindiges hydrocarboniclasticus]ONG41080.1 amino acid dehydrogenase [Alkanindiges hydrocarboniclasticus]
MKIIVLGAGVIGITAAWYLRQKGFEVTVIERQSGAGLETSFANGGQISVSHAEPWANPGAPKKVLKWLMKEDAPLLFRLRADLLQWRWGMQFLRECTPERTRHNIIQIVNLGTYSRRALQQLRRDTGIHYDELSKGILHFYTSEQEFAEALEPAKIMREFGCDRHVISTQQAIALEPALASIQHQIAGATYTAADESGDAHQFTQNLASLCAAQGVQFLYNSSIVALNSDGQKITGVRTKSDQGEQTFTADNYVLALGSYSPQLVKPLGLDLLIYPAKGYSATFPIIQADKAPNVSLTDDEFKLVFSRLGDRLRVAGTAELNGYSTELNEVRCKAITRRVMLLFPDVVDIDRVHYWTGLRPATPSNVPYIGRSKITNLWLDTGHGTLGWTHACGSGRALADIVAGQKPEVDFAFCGL